MRSVCCVTATLAFLMLAACEGDEAKLVLGDQCDLTSQCDQPLVCRLARCRTECATTRDCPIGQLCVQDRDGIGACLLEDETTCSLDSECPEPLVCLGGGCTNECRIDRDCALGATCESDSAGRRYCREAAVQRCALDSECGEAGQTCAVDGVCRDECRTDRDCREGTGCLDGACTPPAMGDGGPADGGPMDAGASDAGPPADGSVVVDGAVADGSTVACVTAADCVAPHVAESDCVGGACVIVSCASGREDCNASFADGCEVLPAVDPLHCGACGVSCGAYGRCSASTCDGIEDVAIGEDHACFMRGNGLVLCMGSDNYGQLGRGLRSLSTLWNPFPVPYITDASAVEAGVYLTCVLHAGGAVSCWGFNQRGQLGDGSFTNRASPVTPAGLPAVAELAPSYGASCAITTGGELWCWGEGSCGQNGLGDGMARNLPQLVTWLTDPEQLDTSQTHTCVVRSDSSIVCFGENTDGELGDGLAGCSGDGTRSPAPVVGISDAVQVEVGFHWSCARHAGGTVSCWGRNNGGLGASATATSYDTPQPVPGITNAVQITVGSDTACARLSDGRVMCWGSDDPSLGAGPSPDTTEPLEAIGLTDAVDIEVGLSKTCALLGSGSVMCWGYHGGAFGPDHLWDELEMPTGLPTIRP